MRCQCGGIGNLILELIKGKKVHPSTLFFPIGVHQTKNEMH